MQKASLSLCVLRHLAVGVFLLAMLQTVQVARPQAAAVALPPSRTPQAITGSELFAKLLERNHERDRLLERYSETRNYSVRNQKGKLHAETIVRLHYEAPHKKSFETICEEGSKTVRSLVFKRLMDSELETASGHSHRDSSITPANYEFQLLGEEDGGGRHYFVVQAIPRRNDKYLFEGKIWIDSLDFAIAKISGHPARSPSFWIRRVDFVREYQKIGEFWFPLKDESTTQLKIFGTKILTIEHSDYTVNQIDYSSEAQNSVAHECQTPQTAMITH